jgi:hypothetical protein
VQNYKTIVKYFTNVLPFGNDATVRSFVRMKPRSDANELNIQTKILNFLAMNASFVRTKTNIVRTLPKGNALLLEGFLSFLKTIPTKTIFNGTNRPAIGTESKVEGLFFGGMTGNLYLNIRSAEFEYSKDSILLLLKGT